jgi:hypothetical protein
VSRSSRYDLTVTLPVTQDTRHARNVLRHSLRRSRDATPSTRKRILAIDSRFEIELHDHKFACAAATSRRMTNQELASELEQLVLDNPDLERLEAIVDTFNPFVAMRWTRQEVNTRPFCPGCSTRVRLTA